jgi:DNA polymerase alpha subunit B
VDFTRFNFATRFSTPASAPELRQQPLPRPTTERYPMDDTPTNPALIERFGEQPPDIMGELRSMLRLYDVDAQELFFKWESYSMKMGPEDTKLTLDTVRAFKKDVQEQLEREVRGKARMQQQTPAVQRTVRPQAGGDAFAL